MSANTPVRDSISGPFIRYPIATSLLMAGILFVGLVAYPLLPVAPLPQVDFPTIQISASLPGASPETMASSVAQPLERQFAQIPGVAQMTSTSSLGSTSITIQFDLNRSIDGAANDVQGAINAAGGQLPKTLPSPPTYRKVNPADSPILLLSVTSDTLPLINVNDFADTQLAQQISQISGVAQVSIGGQQKPAIRIQIDPAKLVAKGLQLEDVRSQIAITTVDNPKGNIDGNTRSYTIYANDQLPQSKDWNDVIIAYRNGGPLRIRDIGQAVSGPEDAKQAAWANGKRGVFLVVFKQPGANVIDTVDKIKERLPRLIASIPPSVKVQVISDRTQTIRAAVDDVQFTLLLTIALVVMVIFVFLRSLWATIIPSVTVPLALLGACALMWAAGYSLDNLSLMALTISVGFVVDDAIVMLENISRYIEKGEDPYSAALRGAGEIGFTIVSISISLVAVLIPLLLMGGIIGRLFREFAVVLAMTIFVSLIVSLTLTPMMASRFLKPHTGEVQHGKLYQLSESSSIRCCAATNGPRPRVALALHNAVRVFRHRRAVGLPVRRHSEGLLSATGRRPDYRHYRRRTGYFVQGNVASPVRDRNDHPERSRGRQHRHGDRRRRQRPQQRAHVYHLEAARQPRRQCAADYCETAPAVRKLEGGRVFLQAAQDVRLGGRATRTQFEYTLQDANLDELNAWAPKILRNLKPYPNCATSPPTSRPRAPPHTHHRSRHCLALRHPASIDRRYAERCFRPAASGAVFYAGEQLSRHSGNPARTAGRYEIARQHLHQVPDHRRSGAAVSLHAWTTVPVRPLSISHQGQFPATTISFNLAQELRLDKPPTPFRLRSRNSACRPLSMAASRARRRLSSNHSAPCRC
jgi:HAE1 family hydrophobic/amphiphilic exporter-1